MDQQLPIEMIFEILIRSSLHVLDTCKKVSNAWKNLIHESNFLPFYSKKTGALFGFFVQDITNKKHVSQFVGVDPTGDDCINRGWLSSDARILATSDHGIVCCEKRRDRNSRWYVGKPATNQWKTIPNPRLRHETVGVAVIVSSSKSLHFKIIRLSKMKERKIDCWLDTEYECEIFDSKTWNWRRTRSLYLHYDEFIDAHQSPITIGEFVYWKTSLNNVLAFHATNQQFDKFSLPQIIDDAQRSRLVEYRGGLGCSWSSPSDGRVQLWLTSPGKNYDWTKRIDADVKILEETFKYPYLVGFCGSTTCFMKAFNAVLFFNIEDETFIKKDIDYDLRFARQFFKFRSDLEPVEFY